MAETDIDQLCINTIRTLSIDAIQKAESGHPGTPMAMAPVAYTLWQRFLRFDPADPIWPNRDRFVLSAGHASMLLYSLLFLAEVQAVDPDYEVIGKPSVSLEDIEGFRQLDSRAPGHPEYRWTSGVEATTGPLGQGIATSVGMAIASKWKAARYGGEIFDFDVYAIAGDGCLMEGVSERSRLDRRPPRPRQPLLGLRQQPHHDRRQNRTGLRRRCRRQVHGLRLERDPGRRRQRHRAGRRPPSRSSAPRRGGRPWSIVDSHIGWGSPHKHDTAAVHGEPLGEEEVRETKRAYGWPEDAQFLVPDGVKEHFAAGIGAAGPSSAPPGRSRLAALDPSPGRRDRRRPAAGAPRRLGRLRSPHSRPTRRGSRPARPRTRSRTRSPSGSPGCWPARPTSPTRPRSGSTSTAPSTSSPAPSAAASSTTGSASTRRRRSRTASRSRSCGRCGRPTSPSPTTPGPAIRLSALMELPVIHLFTHDSIGLGEDGPTHQPVEQLASLRAVPGLDVIRPADANEVAEAWRVAVDRTHQPVALDPHPPGRPGPRSLPLRARPRACGAAATSSPTPTAATPT